MPLTRTSNTVSSEYSTTGKYLQRSLSLSTQECTVTFRSSPESSRSGALKAIKLCQRNEALQNKKCTTNAAVPDSTSCWLSARRGSAVKSDPRSGRSSACCRAASSTPPRSSPPGSGKLAGPCSQSLIGAGGAARAAAGQSCSSPASASAVSTGYGWSQ